jgi:hypothetical protein
MCGKSLIPFLFPSANNVLTMGLPLTFPNLNLWDENENSNEFLSMKCFLLNPSQ